MDAHAWGQDVRSRQQAFGVVTETELCIPETRGATEAPEKQGGGRLQGASTNSRQRGRRR